MSDQEDSTVTEEVTDSTAILAMQEASAEDMDRARAEAERGEVEPAQPSATVGEDGLELAPYVEDPE